MKRIVFLILLLTGSVSARDRVNRLGIGATNQLAIGLPGVSFKLQGSRAFSYGGVLSINSSGSNQSSFGAALKFYRNLYDEPHANFYVAALIGLLNSKLGNESSSSFQFDCNMGSEFSIPSLESLGFSFEAGLSLNSISGFHINVKSSPYLLSSIHFYL